MEAGKITSKIKCFWNKFPQGSILTMLVLEMKPSIDTFFLGGLGMDNDDIGRVVQALPHRFV